MKRICICLVLLSLNAFCISCTKSQDSTVAPVNKSFSIYGFIVYGGYVANGVNVGTNYQQLQQYLLPFGIKKLNLLYEQKLLDYPNGDKTNGIPNIHRIDSLALQALADSTTLVSFDLEGWNRYDTQDTPTTPTRMIAVINDFKQINNVSPLGLYATVPQNTYGYSASTANTYNYFNQAYSSVAASVNYFSPSLYNYTGLDTVVWKEAAAYNIQACRLYGFPQKKILPYITPEVTIDSTTTLLSYNDMMVRLQALYDLGADGCLVWTSSSTRDANGNKIYVDVNSGWAKALIDFIAAHP